MSTSVPYRWRLGAQAPPGHEGEGEEGIDPASIWASVRYSPMLLLAGRRFLIGIPVLWGVTFLTFALMNLLPGDAAVQLLGLGATRQQIHELSLRLHLNEPFFVRYWHWLHGILTGSLGTSLLNGEPVTSILSARIPITLELIVYALVISIGISVPVAVLAAMRPGKALDHLITAVTMLGFAIPNFVLALVLIIVFAVEFHLFPAIGYVPIATSFWGSIRAMTLPAVSLACILGCFYTRILRGDLVDQMQSQDYVLTARSKGLPRWLIIVKHALRNSLLGLVTVVALNLGALIGGTVIIEQVFGLGGVGSLLLQSINDRDVAVVEAVVLIVAVVVVCANLLVDLLYTVLDPRIRHGRVHD